MSFVKNTFDSLTGKSSAKRASSAAMQGSDVMAQSERDKLDYLKEVNALPQQLREQALGQLGGAYGLPGFEGVDLTQQAMQSPLYQAQLGNIGQMKQGAIDTSMATSAATGGFRGGNLQGAFADISEQEQLAKNQALSQAYGQQLGGLQGLAGLDTGQNQIAQSMGNIGQIQGQGIIGAAQSGINARQAGMQNMIGLGQLGIGAAGLF